MFVRFRQSKRRLDVSLLEAVRRDGKPRQEHVASLGSISQPPSVAGRVDFWLKLHERLAGLSNRITAEAHGHILGAVRDRVPMATANDQRETQLANARAEAKTREAVADWCDSFAEESKGLLATTERTVAARKNLAKATADIADAAKEKATRIERGENVGGSFGRPANVAGALLELGFTKTEMRRALRTGALTEEQFEAVLAEKIRRSRAASDWLPRDELTLARIVGAHRAERSKTG